MNRRVLCVAAAAVLTIGAGAGTDVGARPDPRSSAVALAREDATAALAIRAVTSSTVPVRAQVAAVPSDLGYRPATDSSYAVDANGSCSSVVVRLPREFDASCQAHDLGYDLLRYAAAKRLPLGPWAREAVDDAFARHLRNVCDAGYAIVAHCREWASIAILAVRANTWRQHGGVPEPESVTKLIASWLSAGGRL